MMTVEVVEATVVGVEGVWNTYAGNINKKRFLVALQVRAEHRIDTGDGDYKQVYDTLHLPLRIGSTVRPGDTLRVAVELMAATDEEEQEQ